MALAETAAEQLPQPVAELERLSLSACLAALAEPVRVHFPALPFQPQVAVVEVADLQPS